MKLQGKRRRLLDLIACESPVSFTTVMGEVYGNRASAKKALREFSEEGWITAKYGTFTITQKGVKKHRLVEKGVSDKVQDNHDLSRF